MALRSRRGSLMVGLRAGHRSTRNLPTIRDPAKSEDQRYPTRQHRPPKTSKAQPADQVWEDEVPAEIVISGLRLALK